MTVVVDPCVNCRYPRCSRCAITRVSVHVRAPMGEYHLTQASSVSS
ncbi:hypothetical protein CPAR01_00341 [Colletotrichum paranaense]|uniref:Uncharacterized protein n=1 Tax=Colletotrichum paranaense TaxID=1914294 RepID=A0ABQ9T3T4_9PEZI|nr:uncharacterized protein CPAR01_00341 [Colletotrichum paranaense]KAK1546374.1 hypothetical protein CPAR01_00341 [Colletotrichum paranaense]